ncbi:uncharacterized protein SOCE836_101890 [Sorangium cellulosum]|uniref:Uncharacterized protein n=1 Tax=Sorangium cellulosum TaxID=56 RepID=A0A4P2R5L3_SORCE|nr:uncharacterized protein SOCE836_101890 [Sorangium cellulosum]WCQ97238.1 hypothetical protein NQZ70_10029 [Sorangium sp. Soce836]
MGFLGSAALRFATGTPPLSLCLLEFSGLGFRAG